MLDYGFVNKFFDNCNKFYSIAFKQMAFSKKIMGTKVIVSRVAKNSKNRKVYGKMYNPLPDEVVVENENEKEIEEFEYVILINLNDMKDVYLRMVDQIEILDNEDKIQQGDILTFVRGGMMFRLKVVKHYSFSEVGGVLNRYPINRVC